MKSAPSDLESRGKPAESDLPRVAWGLASLAAFGMAVTCARPAPAPGRPAPQPATVTRPRNAAESPASGTKSAPAKEVLESGDGDAVAEAGPLGQFRRRLAQLAAGDGEALRVAWFGDSHTAADYWTGSVRRRLQARGGNGGPGFVHVGIAGYQHGMVRVESTGRWHGEPRAPSSRTVQLDGVFGLSGMRARAEAGARAWLRIVDPPAVDVKWSIAVRFRDSGARLSVELGEQRRTLGRVDPLEVAVVRNETLSGPADATLVLSAERGQVEVFGVIAEYDHPGLVLDVLGINGARAETALAWTEEPWVEQLRARAPTLVVLAYGTNEVFDALKPERYEEHYAELMRRVRLAVADADCLIVGPTDVARGGAEWDQRAEAIDRVERQVATRLGCGYFSTFEEMGGASGFESWRAGDPQLAGPDGVHLTRAGYSVLGDHLADMLLSD